jgi:hypothetical protein
MAEGGTLSALEACGFELTNVQSDLKWGKDALAGRVQFTPNAELIVLPSAAGAEWL